MNPPASFTSNSTGPNSHGSSGKRNKNRKVLLMGKSGAGKSSMRSIVFSNYIAKDVRRLGATIDVEHSNIRFMGNLMLNLWDCGGQDGFMESYLTSGQKWGAAGAGSGRGQREHIFSNVAVMIFVFDVESKNFEGDALNYGKIIHALGENSPSARVFVLIHKMDLVQTHLRQRIFEERVATIRRHSAHFASSFVPAAPTSPGASGPSTPGPAAGESLSFYATSIWDQSLYRAWTAVIYTLVPNASALETLLSRLCAAIAAYEVVLYERTTCLAITSVSRPPETANPYHDRFERLSAILKTHKHSLARHARVPASSAHFALLEMKTSRFCLFAERLTENTNLVVVLPPGEAGFNAAKATVAVARAKFVELDVASAAAQQGKVRVSQEMFLSEAAKDVRPLSGVEGSQPLDKAEAVK